MCQNSKEVQQEIQTTSSKSFLAVGNAKEIADRIGIDQGLPYRLRKEKKNMRGIVSLVMVTKNDR